MLPDDVGVLRARITTALALLHTPRPHDHTGWVADIHDTLTGKDTPMSEPIPQPIRDELDQAPAWWDRQYRALVNATFKHEPFNPADHDGHDLVEHRTLTGGIVRVYCTACPTRLIPKETP